MDPTWGAATLVIDWPTTEESVEIGVLVMVVAALSAWARLCIMMREETLILPGVTVSRISEGVTPVKSVARPTLNEFCAVASNELTVPLSTSSTVRTGLYSPPG